MKVEVKILVESGGKKHDFMNRLFFINLDCFCSLAQGEDCSGTPVKVQKTEPTVAPDMA